MLIYEIIEGKYFKFNLCSEALIPKKRARLAKLKSLLFICCSKGSKIFSLFINNELTKANYGKGKTKDFRDYCGKDEYFIMGDNRENSLDSRIIGCVSKEKIKGTTDFVLFPFGKWKVN